MAADDRAEIQSLIDDLLAHPEKVSALTPEQVIEAQKQLLSHGTAAQVKEKSYVNMSIINNREEWMRKFLVTSLIGFLYRTAEEYDPMDTFTTSEPDHRPEGFTRELAKYAVKSFLDRNFNYDPDRHAMSAYKENMDDPERSSRHEAFRKAMETSRAHKSTPELTPEALSQYSSRLSALTTRAADIVASGDLDEDTKMVLANITKEMRELNNELKAVTMGKIAAATADVYRIDPPADLYHHIGRYITNHYEQLREATTVLYAEKPDIEFAVMYYGTFKDEKSALEHRHKNESLFVSTVYTIENGGWTLMGPFKRNRERIDFYNKNTEVLKRMFEQHEQDSKVGKDMLKKRVTEAKRKNIIEAGPDDPGLSKYREALSTIEKYGAKPALTKEEREELQKAIRTKENAEVPPDAIQVDVFRTTEDGNFTRDKFYTQAEAPTFMEEQIEELKKNIVSGKGHGLPKAD